MVRRRRWPAGAGRRPSRAARRCAAPGRRGSPASSSKAATRPGKSLRGSTVPRPSRYGRRCLRPAAGRHRDRAPGRRRVESPAPGRGRPRSDPRSRPRPTAAPVCTQAPSLDGPPHEGRVPPGGGGAELRVPHGGQVPDRDQPGGPAGRRHHEVGAVDHVDRSGPPFHRRAGRITVHARSSAPAGIGARDGRTRAGRFVRNRAQPRGREAVADRSRSGRRASSATRPRHGHADPGAARRAEGWHRGDGEHGRPHGRAHAARRVGPPTGCDLRRDGSRRVAR